MPEAAAKKMLEKTVHYPQVEANPNFAQIEESVLKQWKASGAFQQSIDNRSADNEYVFYDGPPFANGLPHYGHLLTGYVKDLYARYHTMKGARVERRFGWDCHGLPAEMGAEKGLNISGRKAIEDFGIGKFNDYCRSSVMKYAGEWETYVDRQARWVDFANDYKTMDTNFMESVLWAFKQLFDKGYIYESHRVMPYSWAAETPLSNFETKLDNSYRTRTDKAVTVKFKLKDKLPQWEQSESYTLLAWTTTPWTLPSNLALAAKQDMDYRLGFDKQTSCFVIVADFAVEGLKKSNPDIIFEWPGKGLASGGDAYEYADKHPEKVFIKGSDLIGLSYEPLFPYFANHPNAFKVLDGSSFITEGDGTGIVHMAPGFGEDDQRVCAENGISVVVPVDESGRYTDEIVDLPNLSLRGLNVIADKNKSADEPYTDKQLEQTGLANLRIINWLKQTDKLVKQEDYAHNYPHCWRTDTPLIYRALPSWYVAVTKFRDRAVELNQQINWMPEHIRDGQMGHMLATAPDWSISRNRFWGTPIPIWRTETGKIRAFGSIAELEEFFGQKVEDLHRPFIDELTKTDADGTWKRVSDVFDCWFESGSMPFAQVHYPFENKEWFETHFPADFITEYVGQTRGWFNTLIMLSTALFDKPPFKNCICHGVVLDAETGMKYSKRLKNYKDPLEVINQFGADALRWLMVSSPVMRGADLMVDPEGKFIRDVVRLHIKPIWNAYNFFTLYANADGVKAQFSTTSENLMDRYILAKCREAVSEIQRGLDAYDTPTACDALSNFFEVLNNWYIRRNKDRFWNEDGAATDQAAYDTLYTVLVTMCQAAAPLLPMTLDAVYQGLTGGESVHLADFPDVIGFPDDERLIQQMDFVRDFCNTILSIRSKENVRVRQPLEKVTFYANWNPPLEEGDYYGKLVLDETNVRHFEFIKNISDVASQKLVINSKAVAKKYPEKMKEVIIASKQGQWKVLETYNDGAISGWAKAAEVAGVILHNSYGFGNASEDEFQLILEPKNPKGAAALSTNDALVVLDLNITPELKREGYSRDFIRMVQQARKDANLNVSDRIALTVETTGEVAEAIAAHKDEISAAVLATSLSLGKAEGKHISEQELEGVKVAFALSVV